MIDAAHVVGYAAAAMDAWQCAGKSRREAAAHVASIIHGVLRHGGATMARVEGRTVAYWRDQAKAGRLTPQTAQGRWDVYRKTRDDRKAAPPDARADRELHKQLALAFEGRIATALANQGPEFTLFGKGREPDQATAGKGRAKTRIPVSTKIHSNGSHG